MKLQIKEPTRSTNPKLPIEQNNSIPATRPATTMKFNWKANWEILLVLVIIVVGIVITTIAAIRSKDYGQLLAGGGGSSSEQIASVPPLQQTDFQLQNAQVLTSSDDDTSTTRRPARTKTTTQLMNNLEQAASKTSRHNSTGLQHHNNHLLPLNLNPSARSRQDGKQTHQHNNHHHHHHHQHQHHLQHNSKHDEGDFHGGPHDTDHKQQQQLAFGGSTSASHDNYDALSTEPTPSQVRGSELPLGGDSQKASRPSNGRHNVNRPRKDSAPLAETNSGGDPLEEPVDVVDDIHTTRSSLASNRPNHSYPVDSGNNNDTSSINTGGIPAPLFDHQSTMSVTPSLAMHGPYGMSSAPLLNTHQFNSNAQLQALLAQHASNNKLEPPILEQDDMMTSYTRMPSASNISDAMMRDYQLASAAGNSSSLVNNYFTNGDNAAGSGGQEGPGQATNSPPPTVAPRHRLHSAAALPFSVLLSDLIKLTRPASSNTASGAFEQPANTRPQQQSILQQLRSLPGPLLSLLQGSSGPSGAVHELGSSSSHDASESSPHYQRISMSPTEMHSILSRSLRSTSILPAFPAPKDAPDIWIPPTSGGSATVHDAMNSNADFVASNAAGFVRPTGQQQQQQQPTQASSNSGHQTNDQHNQYQPAQDITTNQHQDGQSLPQQQQIPNQSQGHFISIEQHQAQRQTQQQQQQQQQQAFPQQLPSLIGPSQQQQQPMTTHGNIRQDYHHQPQQTQQSPQIALGAQMRGNMQVQMMNQRPIYNTRSISEIQVPLGYNPSVSIQQQQQQQQPFAQGNQPQAMRRALEMAAPSDSAPKATITSSVVSSVTTSKSTAPQLSKSIGQQASLANVPMTRQKREAPGSLGEIEMAASRDNPSEEEEFLDSRPVSIVRPDGRPMSGDIQLDGRANEASKSSRRGYTNLEHQSGRAGEADLPSPSLRKANHMDFDALSHYASSYKRPSASKHKIRDNNGLGENRHKMMMMMMMKRKKKLIGLEKDKSKQNRINTTASGSKSHTNLALDAAGSGLMSKLLGTASNIDDVEEDVDGDDEESANERRKEELEDAEFGLANDERNNQPDGPSTTSPNSLAEGGGGPSSGRDEFVSRANNEDGGGNDVSSHHLGSGSTGSEAYARRNQQRSDIEFYGHPGEETRQLKYGILGSGNYEVVNGGIYPEADESTAAVNSVANYVRKPGALLIAGLPKLMEDHQHPHNQHHHHHGADAAFMPGGRIGGPVAGYMRGASAIPEDIVGHLMPGGVEANKALSSPLLDLIDAQGGSPLFDPNLVAHLGSSGTSARTTHTSKEGDANEGDDGGHKASKRKKQRQHDSEAKMNKNKDQKLKEEDEDGAKSTTGDNKKLSNYGKLRNLKTSSGRHTQHVAEFDDPNTNEQDTRSSSIDSNRQALNNDYNGEQEETNHRSRSRDDEFHSSGTRDQPSGKSQRTNQFNSYQILPSKKVTIFSDQDLDSAPSSVDEASHSINHWHT